MRLGSPCRAAKAAGPKGWCFSWAGRWLGEGATRVDSRAGWIQEFSIWEEKFLSFECRNPCACVVLLGLGRCSGCDSRAGCAGLGCPGRWVVLPSAPPRGGRGGPAGISWSGFGFSSALWGDVLLQRWWPGRWGTLCNAEGCAGPPRAATSLASASGQSHPCHPPDQGFHLTLAMPRRCGCSSG